MMGYTEKYKGADERGRAVFGSSIPTEKAEYSNDPKAFSWKSGIEIKGTSCEGELYVAGEIQKIEKVPVLKGAEKAYDALLRVCEEAKKRQEAEKKSIDSIL